MVSKTLRRVYYLFLLGTLPVCLILIQLHLQTTNTMLGKPFLLMSPKCDLLFEGDPDEIKRVNSSREECTIPPEEQFLKNVISCSWIIPSFDRGYYVSEKEKQFPLAFALNVHNSPQQIFKFLKIIYRAHNVYCIHYDLKSENSFKNAMTAIADCLPNVIVASKIENVTRSWHTVVDAQMNCISDLYKLRDKYPWRYVMTLCGKEVPLRTNGEMVQTLMKLNGTSAVQLTPFNDYIRTFYWTYKSVLPDNGEVALTGAKLGPVPFNISMAKSYAYYGLSDIFVDFLLHDEKAKALRSFTEDTILPEELFVASLFSAAGVPGGKDERFTKYRPDILSCIWLYDGDKEAQCSGDIVHDICIINSGDLHRIRRRLMYNPEANHQTFFFNKYFIERDRVVIDCVEQELLRRNREEHHTDTHTN